MPNSISVVYSVSQGRTMKKDKPSHLAKSWIPEYISWAESIFTLCRVTSCSRRLSYKYSSNAIIERAYKEDEYVFSNIYHSSYIIRSSHTNMWWYICILNYLFIQSEIYKRPKELYLNKFFISFFDTWFFLSQFAMEWNGRNRYISECGAVPLSGMPRYVAHLTIAWRNTPYIRMENEFQIQDIQMIKENLIIVKLLFSLSHFPHIKPDPP